MLCPACKTRLTMSERQGIEIDYCPSCRGVWLDRGELDKVIERLAAAQPNAPQQAMPPQQAQAHHQPRAHYAAPHHGYQKPYDKRRKSFLEELFD